MYTSCRSPDQLPPCIALESLTMTAVAISITPVGQVHHTVGRYCRAVAGGRIEEDDDMIWWRVEQSRVSMENTEEQDGARSSPHITI